MISKIAFAVVLVGALSLLGSTTALADTPTPTATASATATSTPTKTPTVHRDSAAFRDDGGPIEFDARVLLPPRGKPAFESRGRLSIQVAQRQRQ